MDNKVSFEVKLNFDDAPLKELSDLVREVIKHLKDFTRQASEASKSLHEVAKESTVDEAAEDVKTLGNEAEKAGDKLHDLAAQSLMLDTCTRAVRDLREVVTDMAGPYDSFETSMRKANTMAGKSSEEYKALKRQIRDLSKEIPMAREELAEGLYQTISNGVPEADQGAFLEQSARASVGGVADLGQTVTVTSTIIKNYGLAWAKAGEIQDKIQLTAKNGVTSFEQLAGSLPRVTGSASQLGVEVNELMATFATTTGVTGNTAEVSTQLAAVLNSLIKPTSEATAAADAMGIRFDAASIKACGGFQNFLVELDASIKAYAAESGQLEQTIYGQLFGSAEALRLIGSLTGEQKDKFAENIAAMNDSAGTIDAAYAEMTSGATAFNVLLKNNIQSFIDWAASIASTAGPFVALAANLGTTMLSLRQVSLSFKAVTVMVKSWDLATKAAIVGQKAVMLATKAWSAAQVVLNAILTANPIGIIVVAIGALVAGIIYAYNNCEEFRAICDKLWVVIKQVAAVVWDFLVKAFEKASEVIKKAWEWIKKFFGIDGEETAKSNAEALDKQAAATENLTEATDAATDSGLKAVEAANWQSMSYDQLGKAIDRQKTKIAQLSDANSAAAKKEVATLRQMEARYNSLGKSLGLASGGAAEIEVKPAKGSEKFLEEQKQKLEEKLSGLNPEIDPAAYRKIIEQIRSIDYELEALEHRRLQVSMELQFPDIKPLTAKDIIPEKIDLTKGLFKDYKDPLQLAQVRKNATAEIRKLTTSVKKETGTLPKTLNNVSSAMRSLSTMTESNASKWLQYGANVAQACATAIPQLIKLFAINQAYSFSEAIKGAAGIQFPASIAAIAANVAAVAAAFAAIPKFADGGIAYGPTLGIFGEYAGAANNPEVVAPLNKLKELIAPAASPMGGGTVRFVIERGQLVGVLDLANRLNRRR